jgi:hypothetical protein
MTQYALRSRHLVNISLFNSLSSIRKILGILISQYVRSILLDEWGRAGRPLFLQDIRKALAINRLSKMTGCAQINAHRLMVYNCDDDY